MEIVSVFVLTAVVTAAAMLLLWAASVRLRNVAIVDVYWGPGFAVIATVAALFGEGATPRRSLVVALTALWGLRLGAYLLWRNWGAGEDHRYRAIRRGQGERFWLTSLFIVFLLQGVLMWVVSLPLQVAATATSPPTLAWLDGLGVALWAAGFLFESVGDWQLARFKSAPGNAGRVMDRGLWRYTRHPNYFGDFLVWWGLFAIALGVPGGVWTLIGPVIMSVLLLRVSGVALLERSLVQRRPAYRDYVARTSAFFPRPPRRSSDLS